MAVGNIVKKVMSNAPVGRNANIPVDKGGLPFVPNYHDTAQQVTRYKPSPVPNDSVQFTGTSRPNSAMRKETALRDKDLATAGALPFQYRPGAIGGGVNIGSIPGGQSMASGTYDPNNIGRVRQRSQTAGNFRGNINGSKVSPDGRTMGPNGQNSFMMGDAPQAAADVANSTSAQSWAGRMWDKGVNAAKFSEGPAIPAFTFDKARGVKGNLSDNYDAAKTWYGTGTKADKWKKAGYTAGAYVGANAAGRALTGGGTTYNADGERDIMGVPFV